MTTAKIIDFGLSIQYKKDLTSKIQIRDKVGTTIYMAPELIEKKAYWFPVDIWSCGLILYWILTLGKHALYIPKVDNEKKYREKLKDPK